MIVIKSSVATRLVAVALCAAFGLMVRPASAGVNLGTVQVDSIGHRFFQGNEGVPGPPSQPNGVVELIIDQSASTGGGALLPSFSANLDTDHQFSITVVAPPGQKFLVHVPAGQSVYLSAGLSWNAAANHPGGDPFENGGASIVLGDLEGGTPGSINAGATLTDFRSYLSVGTDRSPSFVSDFAFTSVTLTGTVNCTNTSLGTLNYHPSDGTLALVRDTLSTADPGRFVQLVPVGTVVNVTPPNAPLQVLGTIPSGVVAPTLGPDGRFYAVTETGGANNHGTVLALSNKGDSQLITSFAADEADPTGGLALGADGNFYGTSSMGGTGQYFGSIFKMTPGGGVTQLLSFNRYVNGAYPEGSLTLGPDGAFYGNTPSGGTQDAGTIFRITTNGNFSTLYMFSNAIASRPRAGLTAGPDGALYGSTDEGDVSGHYSGTLFRVTPNGDFRTLVYLTNVNSPRKLVLANDGNFYGVTGGGGAYGMGSAFRLDVQGTFTTLANFDGTNGMYPTTLISGPDGALYGATRMGGTGVDGTIFKLTTDGSLSVVASFTHNNGSSPTSLFVGADGNIYGTTDFGDAGPELFRLPSSAPSTTPGLIFQPRAAGAAVVLALNGLPNTRYVVQSSDSLLGGGAWSTICTNQTGPNGAVMITDSRATNSQRFYRVGQR